MGCGNTKQSQPDPGAVDLREAVPGSAPPQPVDEAPVEPSGVVPDEVVAPVSLDAAAAGAAKVMDLGMRCSFIAFFPDGDRAAIAKAINEARYGEVDLNRNILELPATLLELPTLKSVSISDVHARSNIPDADRRALDEGMPALRAHLEAVKAARREVYDAVGRAELDAIKEAISSSCNEEWSGHAKDYDPRWPDGCAVTPAEYTAAMLEDVFAGNISTLHLGCMYSAAVPPQLERLGRLNVLRVLKLSDCGLRALPEYVGSMHALELLDVQCNRELSALPASLGRLGRLRSLIAYNCAITRIPDSFGELQNLRVLGVSYNQLTELPRSVAFLPKLETLAAYNNPWQLPPKSVMDPGDIPYKKGDLAAIRRYFNELDKHGSSVSKKVKMVLVGTGEAGKSSTLRGMKHGEPRPFAPDERTVQLDIWLLELTDVIVRLPAASEPTSPRPP